MARILIIDDDEILCSTLGQILVFAGHTVAMANDGFEAAKLFRTEPFQLILTDIIMPNREGIETIITLHREFPDIGVIAMSGGAAMSKTYLGMAERLGAHRALTKPFSPRELNDAINETLARHGAAPRPAVTKPE